MRIGFIGAGKVGCSLGKYFSMNKQSITGFFSQTEASAKEAAQFTDSIFYPNMDDLIRDSDILFLTVTDGAISTVWNSINKELVRDKIFCHCSGSLSSGIFSDIDAFGAYGYSVHPLYAIASKTDSYKDLRSTLFTLEGHETHLLKMQALLENMGNSVQIISTENKVKYHAAAVFASNHMVAIAQIATDLLADCGFSQDRAIAAIKPLMEGNLANILAKGPTGALTGPVERNDATTITRHLSCMPKEYSAVYKELTRVLVSLGQAKHPDADYSKILDQCK